MKIKRGSTSVRRLVFIADSSSTTGAGLANLTYNSSGLVAYYFAGDLSNEVAITLATATLGTYTSGGFVAVDNTNMPGWYEIGIPDAALDGGNECAIQLRGATNMVPVNIYIELDAFDYQTATQPVNVTQISGDATAADNAESFFDGTGYAGTNNVIPTVTTVTNGVTVSDKTGFSLASGGLAAVTSWTVAITGDITGNLSGSVGSVSGNVEGNVTGSVGSISGVTFPSNFGSMSITIGGAVTAGTVSDKTGYSLTPTTGLGNQTANITGNLSGSVGSVSSGVTVTTNNDKTGYSLTAGTGLGNQTANITGSLSGSVGSVSGNVGGNVVGSVGSVSSGVTVTTNNDKSGYSLATAPPTAAAIADAVWDEARAGHTTSGTFGFYLDAAISSISGGGGGGGSSAADIWAYATRTLTSTLTITTDDIDAIVAGVTAAGAGLYNVIRNDELTLRIGDEFEQSITGLGNIASRDDLVFTLKAAESDADTAAKIYLSENNGLTRLNGAAYATTANGTITVDDEVNGDITIRISSAATASLTKATRVDAVKVLQSGGNDRTPRVGRTQVLPVVVEARG